MELYKRYYDALQPETPFSPEERKEVLREARDYFLYLYHHDVPDRQHIAERTPQTPVDETLEHQIRNFTSAMEEVGTPQSLCASGFLATLFK